MKSLCTKSKGNRKVYWNPIYEEIKAKTKAALDDEQKATLYAKRNTIPRLLSFAPRKRSGLRIFIKRSERIGRRRC
ncbi:transposase [Pallidibacillus thermolactis]|uniref:transposase n=1 Tax=Pallidibacillus thermolactis TaxID=251051 RepID=UPI0021DB1229|nr:transposase [Pallidibacillus thermolactis]MCU9599760.1 transposase [Pallidibacillus thermolactis subsp. kokeshiiformis]